MSLGGAFHSAPPEGVKAIMKILAIQSKESAVTKYRLDPLIALGAKKTSQILRKNEEIELGELAKRYKKKCDVLVIKYIQDIHTLDVIFSMRNIGGFKVVVDIDDNIWNTPIGNATFTDGKLQAHKIVSLTESVKSADYVTVSTEPLKELIAPLNENVTVIPNFITPSEWNFERKKNEKTRIGWVWSPTHFPDIQIIQKSLEKIIKKYPVEIVIFGTEKNIFPFETTNIKGVKYTDYPKTFMEEGIDISIAPLADNDFNKSKSNIKWLESSMAGACFVGSRVYPYSKSIKQGKTGLLCNKEPSWTKTLSTLIEHPLIREQIAKNAKEEVMKNYSSNKKWKEFYDSIK